MSRKTTDHPRTRSFGSVLWRASKASVLIICFVGGAIIAMLYFRGSTANRFDFPEESDLISRALAEHNRIDDIAATIKFRPHYFCVSVGGLDPREIFNTIVALADKIDVIGGRRYSEGYRIFLFVGQGETYIEKFDYTDLSFDQLRQDFCTPIVNSFSIEKRA